jgi:hypothetical protein
MMQTEGLILHGDSRRLHKKTRFIGGFFGGKMVLWE